MMDYGHIQSSLTEDDMTENERESILHPGELEEMYGTDVPDQSTLEKDHVHIHRGY